MSSPFARCVLPRLRTLLRTGVLSLASAAILAHADMVNPADFQNIALNWARTAAQAAAPVAPTPLQFDVSVGSADSRLRLAPCANVEPYLPVGARLWGRSRVGLRCVDGVTHWNISLPLTVKVTGMAWVVRTPVAAGSVLTPSDAVLAQVDWAEENSPVLAEPAAWVGQVASFPLSTGQVLRQTMVRPAQVFAAGAAVRVVAQGAGFQASSEAQALSAGVIGQLARVRMDNGRIATGTVLDARTVRIDL